MSDDATPRLALPYLAAAQAQKHVTVNEALAALDALTGCAVLSRTVAAQPASPGEGAAYLLPAHPTGADWALHGPGDLLRFEAGAWSVAQVAEGLLAFVVDERRLLVRDAAGWTALEDLLAAPAELGLGATADATHRLAVASPNVLFTHDGDSLRVAINKAAPADTASVIFETAFSGRAEVGLAGDDVLRLKVSADGTTWLEALRADATSRCVDLPAGRLRVLDLHNPVPLSLPAGAWAAQLLNSSNAGSEHGVAVGNVWYSPSTWAFLVGTPNGQVSATFTPFFGVRGDGRAEFSSTVRLASTPKAALPPAADRGAGALLFVPDDAGGPVVAYSDGASWRRIHDRASVA